MLTRGPQCGMTGPAAAWTGTLGRLGDSVNVRLRENDWEGDVQQPLVTLALEVRTVNGAGSPERAALLAANVARER